MLTKKYKAVIFDVNDTIINTLITAYLRNNYCLKNMGLSYPSLHEFIGVYGNDYPSCLSKWLPPEQVDHFFQYYKAARNAIKYKPLCDIKKLMDRLKLDGFITGVVTNSSKDQLYRKFHEAQIDINLFNFVYFEARKPQIAFLNTFLNTFSIKPSQVLYIGDDISDFIVSKELGVDFIATITGKTKKSDFLGKGLENRCIVPSILSVCEG